MLYDTIAVSTIVKNKSGGINFCDIPYAEDLEEFNRVYLENTLWVAEHCDNIDLSAESMVIGTSAIIETELDGIDGMNTGIFNNPFLSWGRYRKKDLQYELPISFQFHHTIRRWTALMRADSWRICKRKSMCNECIKGV